MEKNRPTTTTAETEEGRCKNRNERDKCRFVNVTQSSRASTAGGGPNEFSSFLDFQDESNTSLHHPANWANILMLIHKLLAINFIAYLLNYYSKHSMMLVQT